MATRYTIRTEEGEREVADLDSLVGLARQGRIGRATLVQLDDSDWAPVDRIPEVARVFRRDPWSAWQGQSDDGEDLLKAFEEPSAEQPVRPEAPKRSAVEDLPASAVAPIPERKPVPDAGRPALPAPASGGSSVRRPAGEVIAFPGAEYPQSDGAHALDFRPSKPPAPASKGPSLSGVLYQIHWLRMALIVVLGLGGTGIYVWYVHTVSTSSFIHRPPKRVLPSAVFTTKSLAAVPHVSPFEGMEQALRDQLMEGILDIGGEEAFEVALLIELRRVRLDVAWARVKIESWAGRNKDIPEKVRFQVRLRGRADDLDQDLGALGLVLGKYIQHYGLETIAIEVLLEDESGSVRQVRMQSSSARRFFTHRMSLEEFLEQAFVTPG
jgi:hypothetical protein